MDLAERLAQERRARLAAERLLELRSKEHVAAHDMLSRHARGLSDQVVEYRAAADLARQEVDALRRHNQHAMAELAQAHDTAALAGRRVWGSLNTIRDGFAVFGPDQRLLNANRAYGRAFAEGALQPGRSYAELLHSLIADDRVILTGITPADWVAGMLSRLKMQPIPVASLQLASGTWVRLVDRRTPEGDMVSLAIDITDQMRIWAAIEAIPDGFVLFDREDRMVVCNQSYRDIYAASAPIMVPGVSFETILRHGLANGQYPEALGQEEAWIADRLREHRGPRAEGEHQLQDGRWLRSIDKETPDGGRVGLRVDITQLRTQQAALDTARRAAEAANRAKSAFLANMSHEIRTPMNGVVGMAELLCDTPLSDEQRLFAETIRSSGEALLVIINDVLDYSKIEAERLTLHPEPFDLERTIHEVAMLLQPRAREKGLDLMIDFDVFLPTAYIGDPGRLRQVLTNLLGNAVKFTETGHVLVRVVGLETDAGRQQLHITVEDTGIGIAAEHLDHIFGEFNQVEEEQNRKFEGTGLGLAISRRLIERMGGAVWVDSEAGRGSVFGFKVTLDLAETTAPIRPPTAINRVMVVDDQFINRTILERQLTPCGIDVILCRSGEEALAVLATNPGVDLVLTDHLMPDMDGVTLAMQIRATGYDMPVLLLSSHPAAAREREGAVALDAILQKPLLRSALYARLRALTGEGDEIAPPAPAALSPPTVTTPTQPRAMRVLAAEDNRTNQLVFQKMVRDMDLDLVFAANGREAVDLWQSFAPDLIFMDISMPEMDGKQATAAIRAAEAPGRRVPIVALTAHAMEGDADSILSSGLDHYMTKPLRRTAIAEMLAQHCPEDVRPILGTQPADG